MFRQTEIAWTVVLSVLLVCAAPGAIAGSAYAPMQPFATYAGKTWRAESKNEDGKPVVDVSHWEFILGGRALQMTHSINGGEYGGRTILFYDEGTKEYVYHYFTTAGFHTLGKVTLDGNRMISTETVKGHKDIVEVRATAILGKGEMKVDSEYVKKDRTATPGHSFHYREARNAKVTFREPGE